jgi:uncharacterized Zn finger protein
MSRYYGGWAPYVPVAERRRKAARVLEKRCKAGHSTAPVTIEGRAIATTFWGKAWCDNLEAYHDYENRLPRGRTYVRNGSVVDLQIAPGRITAAVCGSELYDITITIKETPGPQWRSICADCAGSIDSLVELLQGRFSKGVMERLCRQQGGLFPRPSDIRFSCTCPDHALMCKHVAAALYGVGARLDQQPELLFRLRAVDERTLVGQVDAGLQTSKQGFAAGRVLEADDVSALFGLDLATPDVPEAGQPPDEPKPGRTRRKPPRPGRVPPVPTTAIPRAAGPKRASAGALPAKPSQRKTMTPAKHEPIKPVVQEPAPSATKSATKSAPATQRVSKRIATIKAPTERAVLQEAPRAPVGIEVKAAGSVERGAVRRQVKKSVSAAMPNVAQAPARGRSRPSGSRNKTSPDSGPVQKPVKWW